MVMSEKQPVTKQPIIINQGRAIVPDRGITWTVPLPNDRFMAGHPDRIEETLAQLSSAEASRGIVFQRIPGDIMSRNGHQEEQEPGNSQAA